MLIDTNAPCYLCEALNTVQCSHWLSRGKHLTCIFIFLLTVLLEKYIHVFFQDQ